MAKPSMTFEQLRRSARNTLRAAGIESDDIDTKILMRTAFGMDTSELIANARRPAPRDGRAKFEIMLARRTQQEPISYIVGKQPFWSLDLMVTPDVLIPRPETEGVVEKALSIMRDVKNPVIVDVGTGSGAILVSLLYERKDATGIGLDISTKALDVARINAIETGVADRAKFVISDYLAALEERVSIVVSNPPYITDRAMDELSATVADYEPSLALRGGEDGLNAYRRIAGDLLRVLSPGGMIVFETGFNQGTTVAGLLTRHGFEDVCVQKDLAGHDRVVCGKLSV